MDACIESLRNEIEFLWFIAHFGVLLIFNIKVITSDSNVIARKFST